MWEVLDALKTTDYDLVLMDVQMPELDGIEATKIIRDPKSGVRNHDIPIIAMTAHVEKSSPQHCLDSGMNAYLSKPLHAVELLAAIRGQTCPASSISAATPLVKELAGLLDTSDIESEERVKALRGILNDSVCEVRMVRLEKQINHYDFKKARKTLAEISAYLEIPL